VAQAVVWSGNAGRRVKSFSNTGPIKGHMNYDRRGSMLMWLSYPQSTFQWK